MRINLLSSFAAGLLISTTVCGAVYFTHQNVSTKPAVQASDSEMKNKLETKGYIVQTKAEYDQNINNATTVAVKQAASAHAATAAPPVNKNAKIVTKVIVNVTQGITSIDIGNILLKAGMVTNAFNFSQDIQQRGLDKNLRPGIFIVDSSMTYDQVISTIFKK